MAKYQKLNLGHGTVRVSVPKVKGPKRPLTGWLVFLKERRQLKLEQGGADSLKGLAAQVCQLETQQDRACSSEFSVS